MLDDPRFQLLGIMPNLTQEARPYALLRETVTRAQAQGVYKVMLITGCMAPEVHRLYRGAGVQADATASPLQPGRPTP